MEVKNLIFQHQAIEKIHQPQVVNPITLEIHPIIMFIYYFFFNSKINKN